MEIKGEVNVYHTVDEYFDVECELDMDRLAEDLLDEHQFVSVTTLHGHVRDYCDDYVADRVSERVEEELAERDTTAKDASTGLTPDELVDVVNSLVDERLTALFKRLAEGL
tara:strand:- start:741 stop:1073 length:333 start_codon:yes stop_codon:yes gene_type:complete